MTILISIGIVLMALYVLVVPKGQCTDEILKQVTGSKSMLSYLPFYNSFSMKLSITGEGKAMSIISYASGVGFMLVILERLFNTQFQLLTLIATGLLALILVTAYIIDIYLIFTISNLIDEVKMKKWAFLPPVGYFILVKHIHSYFKKNKNVIRGTFDGE